MNHPPRLYLLVAASLALDWSAAAFAQTIYFDRFPKATSRSVTIHQFMSGPGPEPTSHRRLSDTPGDLSQAEELLTDRLRTAHESREMQDLVQQLRNPQFLRELGRDADLKPGDLNELLQRLQGGHRVGEKDPAWNRLLQQASRNRHLSDDQISLLKRWGATGPDGPDGVSHLIGHPDLPDEVPVSGGWEGNGIRDGSSAGSSSTPRSSSESGRPDNFWEWSGKQVADAAKEGVESAGEALDDIFEDSPDRHSFRDALRQFGNLGSKGGGFNLEFSRNTPGVAGLFPTLRRLVPLDRLSSRGFPSIFRNTRMSGLPGVGGGRSLPSVPHASGPGIVETVLWGLLSAGLGIVLWKSLAWYRATARRATAQRWRPGPWPVAPDAVSTRAELIAAFEHLAFVRLGLLARTCHHLELASRLADSEKNERVIRRQAAEQLARIYEQARYAPEDGPLPEDVVAAARRDLCFLAGVASA